MPGKQQRPRKRSWKSGCDGLAGMDRLVDDYVGDKIPLWEKIMDRQVTVCCAWEKTAFEEGLKVGIRLMMEARYIVCDGNKVNFWSSKKALACCGEGVCFYFSGFSAFFFFGAILWPE